MSLHPCETLAHPAAQVRVPAWGAYQRALQAILASCFASLTLGLAGCRATASPADQSAKRMIENVMQSYTKAYRNDDPDAMAALYAEGAMLLPPGHELVKGRDSVRAFWSRGMEAGFEMATVSIEVSGNAGYVVGRYYVPPDDEDDAETGKYIIALRRERDGVWRITADIWNADEDDDEPDESTDSTRRSVALVDQVLETITQSP
jgi:uncharacterized protein (TIGR02246 family)